MPRLAERPAALSRTVIAVVLAMMVSGGGGLILAGFTKSFFDRPPTPSAAEAEPFFGTADQVGVQDKNRLSRSEPTRIDIDAIDVRAPVSRLGTNADGSVQVPSVKKPHMTGWYRGGAAPGQIGAAVILGHVDSRRTGTAVFYELGNLKRGAIIEVTRKDRIVASFRVDRVVMYPGEKFPANEIYGPTSHAALRLITCGGEFDERTRNYDSNVVVYARMVSWRKLGESEKQPPLRNFIPRKA